MIPATAHYGWECNPNPIDRELYLQIANVDRCVYRSLTKGSPLFFVYLVQQGYSDTCPTPTQPLA